jgi:large subunit ribosomal protein L30
MENNKTKKTEEKNLIAVVRISGMVEVKSDVAATLDRLRLRRKYACILLNPNEKSNLGMLEKVRYHVAYGNISRKTLADLLKARGQKTDKKEFDAEKTAGELLDGKKLKELGFKPFFRLHPPRKGIKSKLHYPKGVLGNNKKDINKLIERML